MRELVDDFDDPRLDEYRNLPDPQLLTPRGLFIAEGRLVVSRLLASRRFQVRSLMLTRVALEALSPALADHELVPVFEVDQSTMNRVTGLDIHRGCLAIGERGRGLTPSLLYGSARRLLALEAVGNADNVGSLFRNAAAFGVDGVLIDARTTDPLYRKALRTSMGAVLHVPFSRALDWVDVLSQCRRAGMRVVGLTPGHGAEPIDILARSFGHERVVLAVGHEGSGLSDATLTTCDTLARIPMNDGIDSLNVSTAAAIALYELSRSSHDCGAA